MKKISLGSWAFTIGPYEKQPVDFDTVCVRLRELGFDGIELGGFAPHPNPDDLPDEGARTRLVEKMGEWGLRFSGLAANLWGEKLVNTDDPGPYVREFTRNAGFCRDLGIPSIRVDTVQPPTIFTEVDESTALRRVVETWKQCCEIARDLGLTVTWEFEPGFAFNKPSDVVRILDAVDADNFGILYDTSHGHMMAVVGARQPGAKETLPGGQVELIEMLEGRINHVHLIDSDNTCHQDADGNDETSMHLPFGSGVVDFDQVVPKLATQRLPHDWWTIDLCFWPDAWDAVEHCKKTIDELNKKYG